MKKLISALLLVVAPVVTMASGGAHLDHADIDLTDQASLQRGAKYFVNYCMSCHEAKYMRYETVAKGLGLTDDQVKTNLMFNGGDKMGAPMTVAMPAADAESWFGTAVPDLSLVVRSKKGGSDWLYTYLRSFHQDESRPWGVNNTVFPDVGMPHVLEGLQGLQKAVYRTETHDGHELEVFEKFELIEPGTMSPTEYDAMVLDLTNFLTFVGEPMKLERQSLGIKVVIFLLIFFVLAYLLKKEYWKDIH